MASGVRSLTCAATETTSNLVPIAPEECALRRFAEPDGDDDKRRKNKQLRPRIGDGLDWTSPFATDLLLTND
eukprot:15465374-Alexandrium_andersonii.AAC.1